MQKTTFSIHFITVATVSIQDDTAEFFRVKLRHSSNKINAQISSTISNNYDSSLYENLAGDVGFNKPIEVRTAIEDKLVTEVILKNLLYSQIHIKFKSDGFHVFINSNFLDKYYSVINNGVPPQVTKVEWTVDTILNIQATKVLVATSECKLLVARIQSKHFFIFVYFFPSFRQAVGFGK